MQTQRESRCLKGGKLPGAWAPASATLLVFGVSTLAVYGYMARHASDDLRSTVQLAQIIAIAGSLVSVMMATLVWSMSQTRAKAVKIAAEMTKELAASKESVERSLSQFNALRTALDNHLILSVTDRNGTITEANQGFCNISGYSREELIGQNHNIVNSGQHPKSFWTAIWRQIASGQSWRGEVCNRDINGKFYWVDSTIVPFRGQDGRIESYVSVRFDITAKKLAERDRDRLLLELEDTSRKAGMAEIATGVLHNVGNVLNSVNVSATVITEKVKSTHAAGLSRAVSLIRENQAKLGEFITTDPRGKQLPEYLSRLADLLSIENSSVLAEIEQLSKSVDHIKEVIATQQTHARKEVMPAEVDLVELIEESIRINLAANADMVRIELLREFEPGVRAFAEKHRVLQILINLISNARKVVAARPNPQIRFVLKTVEVAGTKQACVQVEDNGIGIAEQDLPRIFQHGFTRMKDGHGFGLHSSAVDARRMGGSLSVHSKGLGCGATFTLLVPAMSEAVV